MRRPGKLMAVVATALALAIAVVAYRRCHHESTPDDAGSQATTRGRARLAELRHQRPGSIAGTVTAGGVPIANATVCARSEDLARTVTCTTTREAGTYTIELPPGSYEVWASAPKLAGGHWRGPAPTFDDHLFIAANEHRTNVDLALLAGAAEVRGVVSDVRGHRIAGALIYVGASQAPPTYTTRSATDGTFVAWAMPGDIYVLATADAFVDGDAKAVAPTDKVEITLTPGGSLAGIVVEAGTHRPIEDATVRTVGESARTDAGGKFRIPKLSPGRYKPTASSIGGYGETAESVLLGLGQSVDGLVIEVHPVAVVVGRVVIDEGGILRPCSADQGEVMLSRFNNTAFYRARTTTDGDVLLEGVVPGVYQVNAMCSRFLPQIPYPDLVVGDSDVEDLSWKVLPGARVSGRVLSRAGPPIADAAVQIVSSNGVSFANATSGPDGTFSADGLAPGRNELTAYAPGFVRSSTTGAVVAKVGSVASLDLFLDTGGSITGDVVDESGNPAVVVVQAGGAASESGWSDAQGHFTIDALPAGTYEVTAQTEWGDPQRGSNTAATAARPVQAIVTAGKPTHVRLVVESTTGAITGTVVDSLGAPITDAYVEAAREDESATTDDNEPSYRKRGPYHGQPVLVGLDGSFKLTGLPRGRFAVHAFRKGGTDAIVEHVALGDRTRITIRPTGVLAGIVTAATPTTSIDDLTIAIADRAREVSRDERLFHTGGRFALRDLPAGTYRITVDGDPRSLVTVTLAEGERREDLRLVAQPRFTIRGRLVSATTRAPLVGWKVEVPRLESSETTTRGTVIVETSEIAITSPDGRFLIHNMPGGPTTITAGDISQDTEAKLAVVRELTLQGTTDVDVGDVPVTVR